MTAELAEEEDLTKVESPVRRKRLTWKVSGGTHVVRVCQKLTTTAGADDFCEELKEDILMPSWRLWR